MHQEFVLNGCLFTVTMGGNHIVQKDDMCREMVVKHCHATVAVPGN